VAHFQPATTGVGNLFTIADRMNCYIIAGEPQNQFIYPKILPLSDYKAERLLLTYYLSTYLSWSFVLTLYLVL